MSNSSKDKAIDGKEELQMANDRRIEELMKINNRYVRTERHLEQNSDISDPDNLEHSERIQQERQQQMDNLKNIVAYGKHEQEDQKENLRKRLEYTDGYINHNADHMDKETLERTLEKQEHRKEQLDFMN
ncbi:MAG: hypothetical protein GX144_11315 [Clostridiaceae bacterium]|jgi:hypothetical protein|nr:hypothetical protein [Clostridiaceae bacterium]